MIETVIHSADPVTLLGGGPVAQHLVQQCLARAPRVVAADGAARRALALGVMPDAVIGDFDSVDAATLDAIPSARHHPVPEQNSTDFEKCLTRIAAPLVLGLGFMGERLDHELAVYNALVRHPDRRCIILGEHDLCFLAPPRLMLAPGQGVRVSLFPMAPVRGTSTGLRWPIDGIGFAANGRIGTSNVAEADEVRLAFDAPGMLVILPAGLIDHVIAAIKAAPHWT